MIIGLDEFAQELFQEIITESDAEGDFMEDVFFEKFCDHLLAAGELESADRVAYRGSRRQGIQVDGYGGDPDNASGCLSLIISDFHQSPDLGRLTETDMNATFRRLSRFLQKALDPKWRNAIEETSPAFGLADLIYHRWSRLDKVRFFLVSNHELSERVDGRESDELDGRTITYSVWDIRRLHRFATMGHGREDIEIDLEKDFGGWLSVLSAHQSEDGDESYLATIPGKVLAGIYDRWGVRLLEQNVRVFLQARGKVNKGIKRTIETEPSMFFAYNNGLTATAEAVTVSKTNGTIRLRRLKNFQIVNGGQTMASIHMAHRDKVDLSKIFVQMKLSVVDRERANEIVPRISEFANTQNRVNAADFFSNHPFHVRIEEFSRRIFAPSPDGTFRESKWFYERARGQYADARSLLTSAQRRKFDMEYPRSQLFSKTDLAKFLNVWRYKPHTVSLGAQKNFADFASDIGKDWEKNPDNFNEVWYREAVAKAIIFKAAERIVPKQEWYEGGYRANIVAYTISKMAHDMDEIKRSVDFEAVWIRQSPGTAIETVVAHVGQEMHEVLIHPVAGISNVTEWAKNQACWERVRGLSIKWTRDFVNELVAEEDRRSIQRAGRQGQKVLSGIQAQTDVVNAGATFWKDVLAWGSKQGLLTPKEAGVIRAATQLPAKVPTPAQSVRVMEAFQKLQTEGYERQL